MNNKPFNNRSMPPGIVIPVLAYQDVRQAVAWLSRAFGFSERLRIGGHSAQLAFGSGAVVVTSLGGGERAAGDDHSIMVRVSDTEAHYERAKKAGAEIITPPQDYPYGELQYTARDPAGHVWTFSQTIADADPLDWGGQLLDIVR